MQYPCEASTIAQILTNGPNAQAKLIVKEYGQSLHTL